MINPNTPSEPTCEDLQNLDSSDPVIRAVCREKAQDIIGSPEIDLQQREAIADLVIEANQELSQKTVGKDDSY